MDTERTYSFNTYDEVISNMIQRVAPATVLDVGAGSGKYGRMVRSLFPDARITALEPDRDSIIAHGLNDVYDEVLEIGAQALIEQHPTRTFDVVIMGDVIEHMRKSEGVDIIDFLTYRSSYILIVTPEAMIINASPWYLGHISAWSSADFVNHTNWASDQLGQMQLFILRGYQTEALSLKHLVAQINAEALTVSYGDTSGVCDLTQVRTTHTITDTRADGTSDTWGWRAN